MKNLAVIALCFFSSFATADDIEEVTVTARRVEIIVMKKLSENHVQNPVTGDWEYIEVKEENNKA